MEKILLKTTESGLNVIKKFEGFRSHVYNDVAGYPTIGWGHKLKPGENFSVITLAQGENILKNDVANAESEINKLVKVPLNQSQFNALVSFVYNVGSGNFASSTMLTLLNSGNYEAASKQFERFVHADGQIVPDLIARRGLEANLFMGIA